LPFGRRIGVRTEIAVRGVALAETGQNKILQAPQLFQAAQGLRGIF
jgi:hypothetical protein